MQTYFTLCLASLIMCHQKDIRCVPLQYSRCDCFCKCLDKQVKGSAGLMAKKSSAHLHQSTSMITHSQSAYQVYTYIYTLQAALMECQHRAMQN